MVGAIALKKTDRIGSTAREAPVTYKPKRLHSISPMVNTGSSRRLATTWRTPFGSWSTWVP
jgi:hypothetical protein